MGPPHYPTDSGRSYSIGPVPPAGSAVPLGYGHQGLAPVLPEGYYGPGFNRHGQPSPHGPNGPAYAPQLYRGDTYRLPTRLGDAPMEYDYPPPVGAPNDPTLSFGGEGPSHNDGQCEEQALRENAQRSRNQPPPFIMRTTCIGSVPIHDSIADNMMTICASVVSSGRPFRLYTVDDGIGSPGPILDH